MKIVICKIVNFVNLVGLANGRVTCLYLTSLPPSPSPLNLFHTHSLKWNRSWSRTQRMEWNGNDFNKNEWGTNDLKKNRNTSSTSHYSFIFLSFYLSTYILVEVHGTENYMAYGTWCCNPNLRALNPLNVSQTPFF